VRKIALCAAFFVAMMAPSFAQDKAISENSHDKVVDGFNTSENHLAVGQGGRFSEDQLFRGARISLPGKAANVRVSVTGRLLSDSLAKDIERQVSDMLQREMASGRAGSVTSRRRGFNLSLQGLDLKNNTLADTIGDKVEQLLAEKLRRGETPARAGKAAKTDAPGDRHELQEAGKSLQLCVCLSGTLPADEWPVVDPRRFAGPLPHEYNYVYSEDIIRIRVEEDPSLSGCQMQVGLASEVNWEKEIVGWHLCNGQVSSVTTKDANKGPNYMLLDKAVCDVGAATIILRKAKFLGFMTSMYLLDLKTIWPYFGGKKVTFTWAQDTGVGGGSAAEASRDPHYYDDGTLLKGEQSDPVYVVYGDAVFWIPSPAVFEAMGFDSAKIWVRPEERMALVATLPRDGTLLQEMSSGGVYVVYGGAKFGIPSAQVFEALGFDWAKVGKVPDGALAQIPDMPRDGTLLREMGNDTVYLISGQKKSPFPSAERFVDLCQYWENVRDVPSGALAAIPQGPGL
jgi:hypothetical protein